MGKMMLELKWKRIIIKLKLLEIQITPYYNKNNNNETV